MKTHELLQLQSRLYKWLMRKTTPSAIRRVGEFPIAIVSDLGNVRNENQDRVAVLKAQSEQNQPFLVIALCDGMGGMVDGAACASKAIATFLTSIISNIKIAPSERLAIAAQEANRAVYELHRGNGGGTLSAVLLDGIGGMTGINIGDSRIYSYGENRLVQLTVDDTMAGLRPGPSRDLHNKNELLQYIGMGDGLEPHIIEIPLSWELMILTSDGAHYFDKGIMHMVIQNAKEPGTAAKRLIEIAKWCGGRDNASIAMASPVILQQQFDDTAFIQIWDPFGDLQILMTQPYAGSEIQKETPKIEPPVDQKKSRQKKYAAKAPRKSKPKNSKAMKANVDQPKENGDREKEGPQLNIYFNGDMDKDQNG